MYWLRVPNLLKYVSAKVDAQVDSLMSPKIRLYLGVVCTSEARLCTFFGQKQQEQVMHTDNIKV